MLSVIVVARNEEKNILHCLSSIANTQLEKEKFEIILVDDHSTDETINLAERANLSNLKILQLANYRGGELMNSPKKDAIEYAVTSVQGDVLVMTDADCIVSPDWLPKLYSVFADPAINLVTGPVTYADEHGFFQIFQALEIAGLMAVTAYGIRTHSYHLANGANLAIRKSCFHEISGFQGNKARASGDDVFTIQKVARMNPSGVAFLKSKSAIVNTFPEQNLKGFLQQRLRWATKTSSYKEFNLLLILGFIFLFNLSILLSLALSVVLNRAYLLLFIILLSVKAIADFNLLKTVCRFFDKSHLLKFFPGCFLFHIIYIISISIAGLLVKNYHWKGRKLRMF